MDHAELIFEKYAKKIKLNKASVEELVGLLKKPRKAKIIDDTEKILKESPTYRSIKGVQEQSGKIKQEARIAAGIEPDPIVVTEPTMWQKVKNSFKKKKNPVTQGFKEEVAPSIHPNVETPVNKDPIVTVDNPATEPISDATKKSWLPKSYLEKSPETQALIALSGGGAAAFAASSLFSNNKRS